MSLYIHANPSQSNADLPRSLAEKIEAFVIDVDDTLYHPLTGIHGQIKKHVIEELKTYGLVSRLSLQIGVKLSFQFAKFITDRANAQNNVNWIFPFVVDYYRQHEPEGLAACLKRIHAIDYSAIAPQPGFVESVNVLRAHGKRIVFYSNGPMEHLLNVLRQIGFPGNAFGENDIVDVRKIDRNPDLITKYKFSEIEAAKVFDKTSEGYERMIDVLGLGGARLAFADDSLYNFAGVPENTLRIHVVKKQKDFYDASAWKYRDFAIWSQDGDDEGRYFSPVGLLIEKVAACLLQLKPTHALRPKQEYIIG